MQDSNEQKSLLDIALDPELHRQRKWTMGDMYDLANEMWDRQMDDEEAHDIIQRICNLS